MFATVQVGQFSTGRVGQFYSGANNAGPLDVIWFDDAKREILDLYLGIPEARVYKAVLDETSRLIDGFESPLGMELLATVDWILRRGTEPTVLAVGAAIRQWPGGDGSAERKTKIFDDRLIGLALNRLTPSPN